MAPSLALAKTRIATPQAVQALQQVSLHRSREVLQLEGPVEATSPVLKEPLFNSRQITRGCLTGRDLFACIFRIASDDLLVNPAVEALADRYGIHISFLVQHLPSGLSVYSFSLSSLLAEHLQNALIDLHRLAVEVYRAKEEPLYAGVRAGLPRPSAFQYGSSQFAVQVIESIRAIEPPPASSGSSAVDLSILEP